MQKIPGKRRNGNQTHTSHIDTGLSSEEILEQLELDDYDIADYLGEMKKPWIGYQENAIGKNISLEIPEISLI